MTKMFRGGVHPHDFKELSKDCPIVDVPVPEILVVPLQQHIGAPAKAIVTPGQEVKRGQLIGEAGGFVSAHVHSPVSGKVKAIDDAFHPMGMRCKAVVIENDGRDEWADGCNIEASAGQEFTAQEIVAAAKWAGLVGMGGATFPTHVKLSPPPEKRVDTVILNGVECEPFLTADYRLMLESSRTICRGLQLLKTVFNADQAFIGIEANKPDAYEVIRKTLEEMGGFAQAVLLPVRYPQGAEKQLIYACTGREVPSGCLPMDARVCVQNVGTAHAIFEAVCLKRPLTERITTVTGQGVARPANFRVRIGTLAKTLLELAAFDAAKTNKLIYGGPMMGAAHFDVDMPVNKGMSGIVALTDARAYVHGNCIRCGRCVDSCPAGLIPSEFSILGERGEYLKTADVDVMDCIECGACTYICPARRPIVQWIKVAKGELARERARQAAKKQG